MMSAGGPEALTQEECDEMIRMADPNNDGKVSLEEFRDMECWKIPDDPMRARRSRVATPRPDPAAAEPAAAASPAAAPPDVPPAAEPPAAEPEAAAPEAAAPEAAAPEAAAPPAEP